MQIRNDATQVDVVEQVCNPRICQAEAGGWPKVWSQSELHTEFLATLR